MNNQLPVAIIGAGPVGLAAAAHLLERGLEPVVFESGPAVATAMRQWGHVRVFTPWSYLVDKTARGLLVRHGWTDPEPDDLPTGRDIVARYLEPLARVPELDGRVKLDATVTAISRVAHSRLNSAGRDQSPFVVVWRDGRQRVRRLHASAVIDASGSWQVPGPMGVDGLPVTGEIEAASRIDYGLPDVLGRGREDYAGQRVLVVGGGHSASNIVLDLVRLQREAPATRILWALRRGSPDRLVGGGGDDALPARGELGLAARAAIDSGALELLSPYAADRIEQAGEALTVVGSHAGRSSIHEVDRIAVATGFRPDMSFLRELRIELDPAVEAPPRLAPLIDPNLHSCGTVRPHGVEELAHPEPGFYIAGMKSYGRAPTFLMLTGYEQVRSIAAELAGDREAARRVDLVLPETGVCQVRQASTCCGAA